MYNDVIFSNVDFSDFITLQSSIRTNRGYILTKDNSGNDLKLYPTVMKYDNLSKELNIKGEEKYTPITLVQIAPILTTKSISDIIGDTANSGGYIKTNGGSAITSKGIVWDIATNPTVALSTKTNEGIGSTDYKSYLTGLIPSTKYYVKAYATNGIGTSYASNEVEFMAGYTPIIIGTQYWALENLNISTYRNGDVIPQVTDQTTWNNLTTGAWCWYSNSSSNGTIYGKLYNWYAVNDSRGLAPLGWHIPTLIEFQTLTTYLGGTEVAGGKMKSIGDTTLGDGLWTSTNVGATNSSGFTALPSGIRISGFFSINSLTRFWTSTESGVNANILELNYYDDDAFYSTSLKKYGYSVRLIKD
jgi:uncharacterized protein (TIGR02145 family)